ncbi:PREDICTED: dapper homolog 3 [Bison bison bison]|uniref:Dapper homolog 3 n=1 Tax=Bison bison bison TaxID=43346 RepID=A0A6P3IGI7_BISBB|nr:PREDICTED: dapper homolog 3 [Bison bison bison]
MGGAEAEDEEDADEDEDAAAARRAAAALEEQLEALPGLIWDLGQQLGDLSLESGGLEQESGRSSGFYEDPSSTGGPDSPPSTFCGDSGFSGSGSYGRLGPSEPRGIYASERPKSLGDASPSVPETVGARAAVPRSFSAPYPTAAGSAGPEACSSADRARGPGTSGAPDAFQILPAGALCPRVSTSYGFGAGGVGGSADRGRPRVSSRELPGDDCGLSSLFIGPSFGRLLGPPSTQISISPLFFCFPVSSSTLGTASGPTFALAYSFAPTPTGF